MKTKVNPGPLHSHAACRFPSFMIIFGGERGGHPTNELWKFNFGEVVSLKYSVNVSEVIVYLLHCFQRICLSILF